ncbi:polyprenyl synthetase family protein [Limnohabitans planktonicus]|uniref:Polyprenyl synthetase n=1 Tax=Limnohabitans planktonicus II-D5 TaxID=1293045 RepID=A0A2T7UDN8_9BURK|nr:farnesyl diphosphate synthase [Limnohabitans planktonicus]PVE42820.1 polyprenyl synthetase [Limnohabitans planktonicus II-D5]
MNKASDFKAWMQAHLDRVEDALSQWVDAQAPAELGQAMRYAVLDGGKRLRPLLVLAAAEAVGAPTDNQAALRAACALELIHAYSLVHDDMPCMDNDVLRRGKPTVHVQFGQAQALLAGDALQALAFEFLTPPITEVPAAVQAACVGLLARASGYFGMAGGQAIDLASVGHRLDEAQLRQMHRLKTGALLLCGVQMGATCGPAQSHETSAALSRFGEVLGLAFQVVDDILDVTTDSATLGKTAGKDAAADKPTYVALMGLAPAQRLADQLAQEAEQALLDSGLPAERLMPLRALATMVVQRTH